MEADMLKILLKLKDKELKTLETDKAEITIGRNENSDKNVKITPNSFNFLID